MTKKKFRNTKMTQIDAFKPFEGSNQGNRRNHGSSKTNKGKQLDQKKDQ